MRRHATRALIGACAAAITAMGVLLPASTSGAASINTNVFPVAGNPIQHVIVLVQSGHSFDNYFGTRAGVNGIPANVCEPVVAVGSTQCLKPYHLEAAQARAGLSDTLRVTQKAIDGGKMDGFVSAQANSAIGSVAMGHYDRSDLPYYWNLADRFTLFDQFFASSQAGALPNRLVAVAGTADNVNSNKTLGVGITLQSGTVFDQLNNYGHSWKYYVQDYKPAAKATPGDISRTPLLGMPSMINNPANAARITNSSQYFVDLEKGQLPAVSYITGASDSERSPQDPAQGEAFTRSVINALMQSPEWSHTALLLTYDDSGGWYDHQAPPAGSTLGPRVPTLLISPYAKAGYVDHSQMDTASIPAFIDTVFKMPAITNEVGSAGSILTTAVNTSQQPISPAIGPSQGAVAALARPKVATIYFLYLGALLIAALLLAIAFLRQRRPDSATSALTSGTKGEAVPLPGLGSAGTTRRAKRRWGRRTPPSAPAADGGDPSASPPPNSPSGKILTRSRTNAATATDLLA
jgi:phospholipase C